MLRAAATARKPKKVKAAAARKTVAEPAAAATAKAKSREAKKHESKTGSKAKKTQHGKKGQRQETTHSFTCPLEHDHSYNLNDLAEFLASQTRHYIVVSESSDPDG